MSGVVIRRYIGGQIVTQRMSEIFLLPARVAKTFFVTYYRIKFIPIGLKIR